MNVCIWALLAPLKNIGMNYRQTEGEQLTNESSPKIDSGKEEYHGVPFKYSVDPPIPHYHINNRGEPPRFSGGARIRSK